MPHWKNLPSKQFGTYVEYLARLHFARIGADIYLPEIDNKGIDLVVRTSDGKFHEVQSKARRGLNYFFIEKSKFPMGSNRWLFFALFLDESREDGDYFLIPVTAWSKPNSLFVDRNYEGKKSEPEWGLSFSKTNAHLLEPYRFPRSLDFLNLFSNEGGV